MASDYPVAAFYFRVVINGVRMSFQEVSGLEVEMELEEIREGGVNNYKHRLPNGTKYNNLVLKKGYVEKDLANMTLLGWIEESVGYNLDIPITTAPITVSLLDETGNSVLTWNIVDAYPVKYQFSNLKSTENAIAIDTVEFAFKYFEASSFNYIGDLLY